MFRKGLLDNWLSKGKIFKKSCESDIGTGDGSQSQKITLDSTSSQPCSESSGSGK